MSIYRNHLKRSVNVRVAAVGLLLTAPALLTLAIALKTRLGSPVFLAFKRAPVCGDDPVEW
jgi:lipopolysaccharide/colanic/teichoic acid biosynthesis glycosyltransferase